MKIGVVNGEQRVKRERERERDRGMPHKGNDGLQEHNSNANSTDEDYRAREESDEPVAPVPPVPRIGSARVGSQMLLLAPDEIRERYERLLEEAKRHASDADATEAESADESEAERQRRGPFSWVAALGQLQSGARRVSGAVFRFILHFDMHGSGAGNNHNFVAGLIDFIAGSLGGAAQVYVSQPLDTVKVKIQTFPEMYKGMLDCFVKTYRKDGMMRGLYAGSVPAVVANVAENSVLFAAYGGCQTFIKFLAGKESVSELSITENACAGSLAACFSTLTLCPTELVKCKLQALREMKHLVDPSMHKMHTPWTLTRYIWRSEGIRGFYRGLSSTFMREMPGYFFFFGSYEGTRELMRKSHQTKDEIGPLRTMIAGAIGGVCLWTSTFPADVIKSRIQVKNLNANMLAVGADIVRREGFLALYRGLLPSVLRTIPATSTLFVVYEYTKKAMHSTL